MLQPTLTTERLILRPFALTDAPIVQQLANDRTIAETTMTIPHPYEDGMAEQWIRTHPEKFATQKSVTFAMIIREDTMLCGAIGLALTLEHSRAELGYWVGLPYWGQGYCTEAAQAVITYGFTVLDLNRIYAMHFMRNPASGRVMQKIGMSYEGCMRQHSRKWNHFEDLACYGLIRSDWEK